MFLVARLKRWAVTDFRPGGAGDYRRADVTKGRSMSTFDDPFDAGRELKRSGCSCGQHVSEAEHQQARLALRCEPAPSEEARYEGVVASAAMRAMFPSDVAR